MEEKANRIYADMPPVRLFFHAAIPGVISMFAMSVYSILEGIFVGQFIGGDAFAAMNLAMPLVMINFALADMVAVGSAVPISISLGQKDEETASNYFSCSVILIEAASIFMGVIMYLFAPAILHAMGAENQVAELAVMYLRICAALGPLANLTFAMDNYLRISGFVRGSMLLNLLMSGMQIGLLVLFVAVWRMGLLGSALSINVGFCCCAVIALVPFIQGRSILKFCRPKLTLSMLKRITACGMPTFLNNIAGRLFALVMNVLLLHLGGTVAVSAYAVLMYCGDFVQPMLYGFCDSMQPAIGYNWGAESYKRVKSLTKCVFVSCALVSILAFGVMCSFPWMTASVFVDRGETELLKLAAHAVRLSSVKYLLWWFCFVTQSVYNAIQKPRNAAVLTLSTAIVFPLIMAVVLWPLGLDGLWLNQAATYIPVGILAFTMLRKTQKSLVQYM